MGLFDLFRLGWRGTIYKLRRDYDRVREKADRMSDSGKKLAALQLLDQVEPTLVMLEEQRITRFDRARLVNLTRTNIQQARLILKQRGSYLPQYASQQGVRRPGMY